MRTHFRWELVGLLVLGVAALAVAQAAPNPPVLGHSPQEVALRFATYSTDCSTNAAGVSCVATCASASERAVVGNCVTLYGYAYGSFGITDGSSQQSWECSDNSHTYQSGYAPAYLRAEVVCLRTGN
jgi:hypothetical protein